VPEDRSLLFSLARALYRVGRLKEAASVLERLLRLQERNVFARNMLAEIYQRMGKVDLAIQHRERVAALRKSNSRAAVGALVSLASLYHRKGEFGKAAATWERAADLQKDALLKAHYQMSAAAEYVRASKLDRAVALWQKIATSSPDEKLKEQARQQIQATQKRKE